MIDWNDREKKEGNFFVNLLQSVSAKTVLDAATGTGFHSVVFARAGYDVSAIDGCQKQSG
ncbi:MAG: hypothetical protein ABW168_04575 [Sedimenticola sp.]